MRKFETGATRDTDDGKYDYEGFLSPLVMRRFGKYMHKHRVQADGSLRASDNWQKGIPREAYIKSAWRHFVDWWRYHRMLNSASQYIVEVEPLEDALCALLFNAQGYLHELINSRTRSFGVGATDPCGRAEDCEDTSPRYTLLTPK